MRSFDVTAFGQPLEERLRSIPIPNGHEVLLKVRAAGVCHTDLHIWHGGYDLGEGKMLKMAERGAKLPHTMGHENVGEICAIGPECEGIALGELKLVYPWIGCRVCPACIEGNEQLCRSPQYIGIFRPGGYSDYLLVPDERYLLDVGALKPAEVAPVACSGLTVYSAIKKLGRSIVSQRTVVIGAGGLGLMSIGVLHGIGAKGAVVIDKDAEKRDAAMKAGAVATIDPTSPNVGSDLADACDGAPTGVLDFVGATDTVQLALANLRKGGKLVLVGLYGGKIDIQLPTLPLRGISIVGSFTGSLSELRELLEMVKNRKIPPVPIVERSLEEADGALRDLEAGRLIGRAVLIP